MLSKVHCTEKSCLRLTANQSSGERSASSCHAKRSDCGLLSNRIMTLYHGPKPFMSRSFFISLIIDIAGGKESEGV